MIFDYRNPCFSSELPNGVKVITLPRADCASVSVGLWVRCGSRYERKDEAGVSHCIEHMLFKGTRKRSTKRIKEEIEGSGGMLNAFTGEESTCYFAKVMVPHFSRAFEVLADMLENASLDPDELKKEKAVILEEIRMYDDQPGQLVQDRVGEMLWPGQPLGRPISGSVASVSGLGRKHLVEYRHKNYHAANYVVAVSGPMGHGHVYDMAMKWLGKASERKVAGPLPARAHQGRKPSLEFIRKKSEQTHFIIGVPGFSRYHPERYAMALLSLVLGGNMSSRLYEELREKRGLAYDVKAGPVFYRDTGALLVSAGVEDKRAPQAVSLVLRELEKISRRPVGRAELLRAKDYFVNQFYMSLEDNLDYMLWAGEALIYRDGLSDLLTVRQKIEDVKASEIQQLAGRLFRRETMKFVCSGNLEGHTEGRIRKIFT